MDRKPAVLIVDDEEQVRKSCRKILSLEDFELFEAPDGAETIGILEKDEIDVVLLDINLPDHSGLDVLEQIKSKHSSTEVIMMTAFGSIDVAIKSLKNGAYDFLTKPFRDVEALPHAINKAFEKKMLTEKARKLESELFDKYSFSSIIGKSASMKKVFSTINDVAYSSSTVLIQGESGTGKELVAKAIHYNSPRKDKELIAFNCSALTGTLIDSELFGHVKGSFTGAVSDKVGLFEAANNSSIFLDEIGDMPVETQVRLLRVLEESEVKAVGSVASKKVNVRVIAATNRDLKKLVEEKKFREDLYYRLSVIVIDLPPLRSRKDDIPVLAYHFLKKYNERNGKEISHISPEVIRILEANPWEGNVRELENVIERGVVVAKGDTLELQDLPITLVPERSLIHKNIDSKSLSLNDMSFKEAKNRVVDSFAKEYLTSILSDSGGNISKAADKAHVERSNLKKLLKKYKVDAERFKD